MIYCVGRNYLEHINELNNAIPSEMVIFTKPDSSIIQTSQIDLPPFTQNLQFEIELIIKIDSVPLSDSFHDVLKCISHISVGIDFTARDIQDKLKNKGLPWERSKGFKNSTLIGHWLQFDEYKNRLQQLEFSLNQNQKQVQLGNTQDMIYSVTQIIIEISSYFQFIPGDIIFTGTPKGVGQVFSGDLFEGYLSGQKLFTLKIN